MTGESTPEINAHVDKILDNIWESDARSPEVEKLSDMVVLPGLTAEAKKPPARTIGVVGIGSEEAVGAQPQKVQHYWGPAFGDVRDVLVAAPWQPYADLSSSYICSNIFTTKLQEIRTFAPQARSVLEIGAFHGHFLLTALEACPDTMREVWWADNELDTDGSNALVKQNLDWWAARLPEDEKLSMRWATDALSICRGALQFQLAGEASKVDIVHVDGEHTFNAALADIMLGLMLNPKLLIVDDTSSHPEVLAAVRYVSWSTGLPVAYNDSTPNGWAAIHS